MRKTAEGLQNLSQLKLFDSCVGAIDGLSIRIRCPKNVLNQARFYSGNKKCYCLNMQVVCDSNCLIIAVSVKHVGCKIVRVLGVELNSEIHVDIKHLYFDNNPKYLMNDVHYD